MENRTMAPKSKRAGNSALRREAILRTARASFLKRGYDGTSMSDVARDIGGSKGTLWTYFPNKKLLFSEVMKYEADLLKAYIDAKSEAELDFSASARSFCKRFLDRSLSQSGLEFHRLLNSLPYIKVVEIHAILYSDIEDYLTGIFQNLTISHKCNVSAGSTGEIARSLLRICLGVLQWHLASGRSCVLKSEREKDSDWAFSVFMRIFASYS